MRREILLALILGIMAGLAATYGLYQLRLRVADLNQQSLPSPTPALNATPNAAQTLSLREPLDHAIVETSSVRLVGKALPYSSIVILTGDSEFITSADQDGDFATEIDLEEGGNPLHIVAITPEGKREELYRSVVQIDLGQLESTSSAQKEE